MRRRDSWEACSAGPSAPLASRVNFTAARLHTIAANLFKEVTTTNLHQFPLSYCRTSSSQLFGSCFLLFTFLHIHLFILSTHSFSYSFFYYVNDETQATKASKFLSLFLLLHFCNTVAEFFFYQCYYF